MTGNGVVQQLGRFLPRPNDTRVTLHIEDSEIRLLVARGTRPVRWRSVKLPPGMIQDGVVVDHAGLAGQLDALFDAQQAPRRRVLLSVGGLHGIVRTFTLPRLKRALLGEALCREFRRDVPVPLDNHHLVSQVLRTTSEQIEALVVAVPRGELEALNQALRRARIRPALVEWKPLSVARALNTRNAAIVNAEADHFDIAIVRDGMLAVTRNVSFPRLGMSPLDRAEIMGNELAVTLGYALDEQDAGSKVPQQIHLLGTGMEEEEVRSRFEDACGFAAEPYPRGGAALPGSEYAANWGLLLRSPGLSGRAPGAEHHTVTVPDLSLPEWRPRTVPLRQGLWAMGIAIAFGAIVTPLYHTVGPDVEAASLRSTVSSLQREASVLREQNTLARARQAELVETEARVALLQGQLSRVESQDMRWPRLGATLSVPGVAVANVTEDRGVLAIGGDAVSYREVVAFAQALRGSGGFKSVVIRSLSTEPVASDRTITRFQIGATKLADGGSNGQ